MEQQEIIGQVIEKGSDFIKVKRDNKTVKINFRGKYQDLIKNVEVSESYKVGFLDNTVGKFTYHNGNSVEPVITKEEVKNESTQEIKLLKPKISDVVIDTIIMQSVQYSKDKNIDLDKASTEVIKVLNKLL
jgi:hypothetical protein